ncbi:MAG: ABC transporter permease [Acidobacteriota bacterium]|nr:ABC transporter permease [Acidobacteriota bacterium]
MQFRGILVNGTLLQTVPYLDAERLVTISEVVPKLYRQYGAFPVNGRHLLEWRKRSKTLEQISAIDSRRLSLTGAGEPEQIGAAYVSANLFPMLGVQPRLGRNFLAEEDQPQRNRVVILSGSLWRRRFSADPTLVGKTIILDGASHVVVGVMPPEFHFFANHDLHALASLEARTDVFRPIAIRGEDIGWQGDYNFMAIAKLKRGVSPGQALAELNVIEAGIVKQFSAGERTELQAVVTPLAGIACRRRRGSFNRLCESGEPNARSRHLRQAGCGHSDRAGGVLRRSHQACADRIFAALDDRRTARHGDGIAVWSCTGDAIGKGRARRRAPIRRPLLN